VVGTTEEFAGVLLNLLVVVETTLLLCSNKVTFYSVMLGFLDFNGAWLDSLG